MNNKAKMIIKNLYYTVAANFVTLAISVLLNLFVPKLLGVKEYSYWQLYVFYSSYVGFLHFGWVDGIYLKIGGENYDDLDKRNLGSQYWYLIFMEMIISFCVVISTVLLVPSSNKKIILLLTAIVSVITIAKTFIQYILQSTNRIKEYAQLSRSDRYIYICMIGFYFLLGGRNFYWLIIMDILSKLIMTLWGMYHIRDMISVKLITGKLIFTEILDNINVGSKLMLSNIASMFIIGSIRFFVERRWTIEVFGKLSFTLSISNMFLTFINAVGVVMFPLLRRTDEKKLPSLYETLRGLFVPLTYLILVFYGPARYILSMWLPEYAESLKFMGILFPIIIYEGRMSLLINTYLKTLRQEKTILFVNVLTLAATLLASLIIIFVMGNLTLAVVLIMCSLAFRCIVAELLLSRYMKISVWKNEILETFITIVFVAGNLYLSLWDSVILYIIIFTIYIAISWKKIMDNKNKFIYLIKN
ncbi:lipopolysaccharide biosynthesis protein [Enterococcus thailandicus]|uniref:lipopolysaccharide biosynthesis protein n=1 Tax=Enterococcus TaxID=1350 RepID=UPI0022E045B6|nr:hypothetical protein [Enterococcus thailandicus]